MTVIIIASILLCGVGATRDYFADCGVDGWRLGLRVIGALALWLAGLSILAAVAVMS